MNISLTGEYKEFVDTQVKSGFYRSASEVVSEGLRLMLESKRRCMIEELNNKIDRGLADCAAGRVYTREQSRARLAANRAKYGKTTKQ
jgi:antitoxin ParD1/3/4